MIFSKVSKREKILFSISITVIMVVLVDKVVFSPVISVIDRLNKQISPYEKELKNSIVTIDREESIINNYEEKVKNLKKVTSNEGEISAISGEIDRLAKNTNVLIQSIKPVSPEENNLYIKYKIDIEAEADLAHIIDFIYQLEKSPALFRVKKLTLTPKAKDATSLKASLLITKIVLP